MRKWLFVIGMFIYLPMVSLASTHTDALQPVRDLVSVIEEEALDVKGWDVTVKESVSPQHVQDLLSNIESTDPSSQIEVEETTISKKYAITHHKHTHLHEQTIIIVSKQHPTFAELIYNVSGERFEDRTQASLEARLEEVMNVYFAENATIFTCVKTETSDKIKGVLLLEKIRTNLNMKTIEKVDEADFQSISGYTNRWDSSIPVSEDQNMNVQMALRTGLGAETTITIGTPIITNEY
ncbi:hypothetical protein N781_01500 [Pontibacillus halophilus JSM 076056 = DSM 19796]|uniref:TATA-box binding protein n=1 Tax=Pontibacillus halophilus JSM 076056 = DSM 19796 TaxID=1385510 RepID=A0A0A5GLC9_9BACI|nr:YwmB family TATA-box binding protein [Pontibacillus halophilus]KGX94076.1 hypothetical protein N781_01500 [Pontibacillus halophilus JSM 076056 = DSM 19796]